jgi:positive regulator of sigma E activity
MTGRVQAVSGKTVIVGPEETASCFGCMNRECRTRERFYAAENPRALPLVPGQQVETGNSRRALLFQAFTVILLPMLGFVAGFLAGASSGTEASGVRGGLAGLLLTALAVYIFRRRFPSKTIPEVIRISGEGETYQDKISPP